MPARVLRRRATCLLLVTAACGSPPASVPPPAARPSILLVTLDTTRADAVGPGALAPTPSYDALLARGRSFRNAWATAPETLPSHASMLTGLLPAGHGIHENGRPLDPSHPLVAERLLQAGYDTAAFVSAFVLARRYGLARGFATWDDSLPAGAAERSAKDTTDAALAHLARPAGKPRFLWVHYFDAHAPYEPPEPYRSRHAASPYHGEVAAVDEQLGRLVAAFEAGVTGPAAIAVTSDHGEGLGDHGERQHGHLLYASTMRVPLVLVGPGVTPGTEDAPVSTRRLFHALLGWAGDDATQSLTTATTEVVLGEAMKPFLSYGWQPQVMAVDGSHKVIRSGRLEAYDVVRDPGEVNDLGAAAPLSRPLRTALQEYPLPAVGAPSAELMDEDERRKLASLGYVSAGVQPVVRKDAPRAADMTGLFSLLEEVSGLFVGEHYARVVPLLRKVLAADPHNLDATLRLATAHSALGHDREAQAAFDRAAVLAPGSADVRLYHALHLARGRDWARAVPALEQALAVDPHRLPALEALAGLRRKQGQLAEAVVLTGKVHQLRAPTAEELLALGELAMEAQQTEVAVAAFEQARASLGAAFRHDLELGVLHLSARRFGPARDALDRVPSSHPAWPMALFKRAQVSVLLNEPDAAQRIARARQNADPTTRPLIARERLFAGK